MFDTVARDEALMQGAPVGPGWFDEVRHPGSPQSSVTARVHVVEERVIEERARRAGPQSSPGRLVVEP